MWALFGMVLGGLPSLIREANERGFKKRYLLGALVGAALIGSVAIAQEFLGNGEALPFNAWTAALSGALIGLGMVIPGVSTSFIMIYLGVYDPFLAAFNRFELDMLVFAGLGALAAVVSLVALVKRLFDRRHGYAYYGALGLLAVSVVLIFPGFGRGWEIALDASLFAACFAGTFFLCRLSGEPSVAEDLLGAAKPADPGGKRPG
jgi:putative membrane protein